MNETFTSDVRGKHFLSAAALVVTVIIIKALDFLRQYIDDKFPQYIPESTITLPEKVIIFFMILFAAVYVIFILILLPMWYKRIRYTITDSEIITHTGLISTTHRIMKLSAVQSSSYVSMPLSKFTGFNFITINALGGRIVLMFLSDKDSRRVMKLIDGKSMLSAPRNKKQEVLDGYSNRAKKIIEANPVSDLPVSNDYDRGAYSYTSSYSDNSDGGYVQLSFPEDMSEDEQGEQLSFSDISEMKPTHRQNG
ncbi:MAG: PH domain-containing protein [Huintestinicola sp.]